MSEQPVSPDDLAVTLAVREELGSKYDSAVLGEFLDRVGSAIDARVDERLASRREKPDRRPDQSRTGSAVGLGFASIGMGIPITAVALNSSGGGAGGLLALGIAWAGIAAVNFAHIRRH